MFLKLTGLEVVYRPNTPFAAKALDGVTLEIPPGQFLALIGATGSGKSTLVQTMNGLVKPSRGRIWADDLEITTAKDQLKKIRQKVGLVFQYPEHQLFEETVAADVAFGPKNLGLDQAEIDRRVTRALGQVGLNPGEVGKVSPFQLSGGQRRRVALAGILAMEPEVLILDEPTAGLDPRGRDDILNQVAAIHRERGCTVILVSHSMEDVARLAQRIVVMHQGKVVLDGSPRQVFGGSIDLKPLGLAVPQWNQILMELKARGRPVRTDALTVDEAVEEIWREFGGERGAPA